MNSLINSVNTVLLTIFNAGVIFRGVYALIKSMDDDNIDVKKILKKYFIVFIFGNCLLAIIVIIKSFYE